MGLEFKLSDRELPVSPVFVHFLGQWLHGKPVEREVWADQRSELLSLPHVDLDRLADAGTAVMGTPAGRAKLARAYTLLFALIVGDVATLHEFQSRFHFITCIGIPRTGGSYLTAEMYRALGFLPEYVPSGIAHDSFPESGPFQLQPGVNSWVLSLKTIAEYLTMVEIYFDGRPLHDNRIVVPKKLTKAAYAGSLFNQVLGEATEYVCSVRHPVASCVSTYEKSGGLPADGRFTVRSNIEEWCRRDLQQTGCSADQLSHMDYFDAYLRYWEHYHVSVATTGLSASRNFNVVAYGENSLRSCAQSYHDRYGSDLLATEFHVSDKARRLHPAWMARAQPVIDRVAATWLSVGMRFPAEEISPCW